jgi:hypothetical protein
MEHTPDHRVDEAHMHEDYRQKESAFREEAAKLWTEEANARDRIRSNVGLTEEERQDLYMESYQGLQKRLDSLSDEFGREVGKTIQEATQTLYAGEGKKFSEHLSAVATVSDEQLATLMRVARRSGQEDLERAVAVTAYERGERGLWGRWAEKDPERAAAVERIKGTPGAEQLYTRTAGAMRPPKANLEDLMPTDVDVRKAAEAEAAKNQPRVEFFGASDLPRRQVGRKVS